MLLEKASAFIGNHNKLWLPVMAMCLLSMSMTVSAQNSGPTGGSSSKTCHDSGFFTRATIITDFCWVCMFPMKIFGVTIPISKRNANKLPSATASPICVCPGRFGIPAYGATLGYWSPDHAIEVVREPFCSPILNGITLVSSDEEEFKGIMARYQQGTPSNGVSGRGDRNISSTSGAANVHWVKIPSGYFSSMVTNSVCAGGGSDMDFGYFTEIDPSWHSELIALYTHPEARLFTKMYATAACMADAVATNLRKPITKANWCLGSWGMLYPFAGRGGYQGNVKDQAAFSAKMLAAMHRRGLATVKYGNSAVCRDRKYFLFPKQQYQFQNFWPNAKTDDAFWIGTAEAKWGSLRQNPLKGDERIFIEFGYQECCITAW